MPQKIRRLICGLESQGHGRRLCTGIRRSYSQASYELIEGEGLMEARPGPEISGMCSAGEMELTEGRAGGRHLEYA